jgi:hypothetical protein
VIGKCRQLHKEELQNLYTSQFQFNLILSTSLCSVDNQNRLTTVVGTSIINIPKSLEKYRIGDIKVKQSRYRHGVAQMFPKS